MLDNCRTCCNLLPGQWVVGFHTPFQDKVKLKFNTRDNWLQRRIMPRFLVKPLGNPTSRDLNWHLDFNLTASLVGFPLAPNNATSMALSF